MRSTTLRRGMAAAALTALVAIPAVSTTVGSQAAAPAPMPASWEEQRAAESAAAAASAAEVRRTEAKRAEQAKKKAEAKKKAAAQRRAAEQRAARARAAAGGTPAANRALGMQLCADRGWSTSQCGDLAKLWQKESGWSTSAHNGSSGAHGIPQALPGSKMASKGSDWATSARTQIAWGLDYIAGRYGNPSAAWAHSVRTGWY
jgi:membrane protein involved in colicin uptake